MIVKFLGILDILAGAFFWLFAFFNFIPESFILIAAFYLLAKGVAFLISKDVASILDIIAAIIFFLVLSFTLPGWLVIITTLYLVQKGVFSLF